MGFLAPAIPWIVKGGALLGGMLGGKKAQSSAQQRSPEEAYALNQGSQLGTSMGQQGTNLVQQGQQNLNPALNYYQALLGGDRAKQAQVTAAPRAAISDTYRGAEHGVERSGLRGATKDLATAELSRDRASKIAGLTTGVQPMAAGAVSDISTNLLSQGGGMQQNASSLFANLLGQGYNNRVYARGEGEKAGSAIGGLLFDTLSGTVGKIGQKSGNSPVGPYGGGYKFPKTTVPGDLQQHGSGYPYVLN